jgi:hypothetical protein
MVSGERFGAVRHSSSAVAFGLTVALCAAPSRRGAMTRIARNGFGLALVSSAALSHVLFAGPNGPELEIPYTALAPAIDGEIDSIWAAAEVVEFGLDIFNVTFRALHDGRTLYLLFHDVTDEAFGLAGGAALYFDDEGGTPPQLWDADLADPPCPAEQNRGEGRLAWRLISNPPALVEESFWPQTTALDCPTDVGANGSVAAMGFELGNGSRTEVALPLDGFESGLKTHWSADSP